jgi:hypothetical protein
VRVEEVRFPTFWANGATGTIDVPPAGVLSLADGWRGHIRTVNTTAGPMPYYWVLLDEPRHDGDGDGPYQEAEIAGEALSHLAHRT